MLLILTWSPLFIWLNIRSRDDPVLLAQSLEQVWVAYGFPWTYAEGWNDWFSRPIQPTQVKFWHYPALAADVLVAVAGIAFLTSVSTYLLKAAISVLTRPPRDGSGARLHSDSAKR